jgi:hypothetical protein
LFSYGKPNLFKKKPTEITVGFCDDRMNINLVEFQLKIHQALRCRLFVY